MKLKMVLYFVKLIMQKVSYIPLENILADDPLPRMSKKVEFSIVEEAVRPCQVTDFDEFIFASTAHERITIGYEVS